MNFFNTLSLKYKISGLVLFCNAILISGSIWSLSGHSTTEGRHNKLLLGVFIYFGFNTGIFCVYGYENLKNSISSNC